MAQRLFFLFTLFLQVSAFALPRYPERFVETPDRSGPPGTNWNYNPAYPYDFTQESKGFDPILKLKKKILIISTVGLEATLTPFIEHKMKLGFSVDSLFLSSQVKRENLREIFQAAWKKSELHYVILIGDDQHLPPDLGSAHNVYGRASDPSYMLLNEDIYPDFVLSRIPFSKREDVESFLIKSMQFESRSSQRSTHAFGLGSNEGDNQFYDYNDDGQKVLFQGERDAEVVAKFHAELMKVGTISRATMLADHDASPEKILYELNKSPLLWTYLGHGTSDSLQTGNFGLKHVSKLTNEYPFLFLTGACNVGDFTAQSESLIVQLLNMRGSGAGAVFAIASTTVQNWHHPLRVVDTMAKRWTRREIETPTLGELFINSEIESLRKRRNKMIETYQNWHLFGDPTLQF